MFLLISASFTGLGFHEQLTKIKKYNTHSLLLYFNLRITKKAFQLKIFTSELNRAGPSNKGNVVDF